MKNIVRSSDLARTPLRMQIYIYYVYNKIKVAFVKEKFHFIYLLIINNYSTSARWITLGTRGFSRVRREFSVLAEAARKNKTNVGHLLSRVTIKT